ncbi:MAG TPA: hypothetical protein PLJ12_05710 [Planctomycetota bacterium]|nr:hypothetical protein [Planctomycetota bacterium]
MKLGLHTERDKAWVHGAWLVLYLLLALLGRVYLGEERNDFGSFEDEPAHLVTAAMMRSYATSFDPAHPLRFIESYYLHFPKVASGQWPPALHLLLGAVMIPFGVTRFGLLVGTCVVAALAAWSIRLLARHSMSIPLPGLLGVLFLGLPLVQNLSGTPMTELLVAALGALAVHQYSKYLSTGSFARAMMYGLLTVLAVLTKGNGLGLVLVPIVAPLLTRRWNRIFTWGTVLSGLMVGAVGYLWYSQTVHFSQSTWASRDSDALIYMREAASFYSSEIVLMLGSLAAGLAVLGLVVGFAEERTRDQTAASIAWLMGLTICYLFLRTGIEIRHLAASLPVLVVFTGRGALWLWRYLELSPLARGIPAAGLVLVGFVLQAYAPMESRHLGFREAVERILEEPGGRSTPWLVASDATGEGLLVSEAVLRDPRHKELQVLRASKVLAKDDWLGGGYSLTFQTHEELLAFLERVPVGFVVLDLSQWRRQWFAHNQLLREVLEGHPERFVEVARLDCVRNGLVCPQALRIYRQVGAESMERHPLTLGQVLNH